MNSVVGFQGEPGSFSDEAVRSVFGLVQTRGFTTFDELIAAVNGAQVAFGLLPLENTIHGSIARSYELLDAYPHVKIVGETTYRVVQSLVAMPEATLDRITHARSHPVAIDQCRAFFARQPHIAPLVTHDTAGAIREIAELGDATQAAIGPAAAAKRYGARVLLDSIADVEENYTRFLILLKP